MEVAFGQVDARAAFAPGAERDDEGVDAARKTKPLLLGIAPGDELLREEPGARVSGVRARSVSAEMEKQGMAALCVFSMFFFFHTDANIEKLWKNGSHLFDKSSLFEQHCGVSE